MIVTEKYFGILIKSLLKSYHMKKISFVLLSAVVLFAEAGCLKDKEFEDNKYGANRPEDSPVGVGFPQAPNKINASSINSVNTPQTMQIALVNLLSDEPAQQDIHVTLVSDPSLINEYNSANDPDLATMPLSGYSLSSLVVTIPKGQRTGTITLTIPNATQLDLTKTYAFGFKIASVQEPGITIASNLNRILVGIAIKNKYDGVYSMKGYTLRAGDAVLTGNFTDEEMELVTAGANTVDFGSLQVWANHSGVGIGNPKLDINPTTNKVTISSSGGASNLPGYDSRYDPASKTFYIGFTWGAGPASRAAIDTLTYLKPR